MTEQEFKIVLKDYFTFEEEISAMPQEEVVKYISIPKKKQKSKIKSGISCLACGNDLFSISEKYSIEPKHYCPACGCYITDENFKKLKENFG